jgi:trans-2,3-dihydro-3-hydroxyanthranilate isomerase
MSITYVPMLRLYRLSPLRAPTLPLIAVLYTAMTVDSARRHHAGRGGEWKGRTASGKGRTTGGREEPPAGREERLAEGYADPVTSTLWTEAPERDGWRRYLVADVFTRTPLEGNQLGVFLDGRDLTTEHMQRTARELNLSETVFFLPPETTTKAARIRIFTPASELPFAGHPILGSAFVLADLLGQQHITLETGVGPIHVQIDPSTRFGEMEQLVPEHEPYERAEDLLEALNVTASGLPVEAYRNGPRHVYVALPSEQDVAQLNPDLTRLKGHDVGVSCFAGDKTRWKTRMFVPSLGVPEDPATGSAAGPLAVHLVRYGLAPSGERIEISQGREIGRPSTLYARVEGTKDTIEHVYVGGSAVVVARGEYRLR